MLYSGQRLQDKATSLHLLSPFAPSKQPKLASCPSANLSPQGTGRKTAGSCADLLEPPEKPRGWTWRGKSGLRNFTFTLCRFETTPGGLSAADICRIIFMLLQSSLGLKTKILKVSSSPSWSLTFFAGDNCTKAGTLALICQNQRSFWVSCSFVALGNRQWISFIFQDFQKAWQLHRHHLAPTEN